MLDVLIVGAGPTGLTLATYLAKHGFSLRIVDKAASPSPLSRALAIQAGTLESLESEFGAVLTSALHNAGRLVQAIDIHFDGRAAAHIDLTASIPSSYPGILVVAQAETERVLRGELQTHGVSVEWNRELLGVDSSEAPVAKVSGESVPARFVVGCDGAHSAVRRALGIGFAGRHYDGVFALADVSLDWQFAYDTVRTFVSTHGALACFPMKGERRYRLVALLRDGDARNLDLARMQAIVDALAPVNLTLADPTWLAEFRVSHRIVDHWRRGNVFLAGDAAHIHSPVGGQGMNTGIQDALCLGDLLRRVLRGGDSSLLRRYERDRSKVARNVLRGTDLPFRMLLKRDNPLARITRGVILPKLVSNELVQRLVVGAVAELRVARREIALRSQL